MRLELGLGGGVGRTGTAGVGLGVETRAGSRSDRRRSSPCRTRESDRCRHCRRYAPAMTHCAPGTTTRSSGACWPQTNRTFPSATQPGGGAGAGGACAETPSDQASSIIVVNVSVLIEGPLDERAKLRTHQASASLRSYRKAWAPKFVRTCRASVLVRRWHSGITRLRSTAPARRPGPSRRGQSRRARHIRPAGG